MRRRLLAAALLAACAGASAAASQPIAAAASPAGTGPSAPRASPEQTAAPSQPSLVGSSVYIYSFLDFRQSQFSPQVLDQIDEQLEAALWARGTTSTVLRFKNTVVGSMYSQPKRRLFDPSSESAQVPVDEVIGENEAAERSFHAKYRLVEFPDDFKESEGAGQRFTIRWVLVDCSTGEILLNHAYTGKELIWWSNGERSESRAKAIIEAFLSTLRSHKLL
jgi:hypothetical protein